VPGATAVAPTQCSFSCNTQDDNFLIGNICYKCSATEKYLLISAAGEVAGCVEECTSSDQFLVNRYCYSCNPGYYIDTLNPGAGCQMRPKLTSSSSSTLSLVSTSTYILPLPELTTSLRESTKVTTSSTKATLTADPVGDITNPETDIVKTQNQAVPVILSSLTNIFLIAATVIAVVVTAFVIKLRYSGHFKSGHAETVQQDTETGTNFGTEFQGNTSILQTDGQISSDLQTTAVTALDVPSTLIRPEFGRGHSSKILNYYRTVNAWIYAS
jgi:hypothetical protein